MPPDFNSEPNSFPPNPHFKWGTSEMQAKIGQLENEQLLILAKIADGKTNGQIATELNTSIKTLERRLTELFQILKVGSRLEAAVVYTVWRDPR